MLVLPIPMIVSLFLSFFLLKRILTGDRQPYILLVLIGLCALQSLIVSLVRYYEFSALLPLQPIFASIIPPIAWLAFSSTGHQPEITLSDLWHLLSPLLVLFCLLFAHSLIDIVIPLTYLAYGIAILVVINAGEAPMPEIRLESDNIPLRLWQLVAITLIASAFSDVVIFAVQVQGHVEWIPLIISLFSSLNLLAIGIISLSQELSHHDAKTVTSESESKPVIPKTPSDTRHDQDIVDQLESLLRQHTFYLDPDLTLAKLARKLAIPSKQLSAAVNRVQGENISRYINRFRIEHACTLLIQGKPIITAVYESGFNTRSNFNREFQRLKQMNPSDWVATQQES